jgi:cation:H+ antiporter
MQSYEFLIYILAFIGVWIGSGLVVTSVLKIAHSLKASSFIISFLILGFLTSLTEVGVAINSYARQELEISVGNLLGGILVLFLLIIPLLAIAGNGIKLQHSFHKSNLLLSLIILSLPGIFMIDAHLGLRESIILVAGYIVIAGLMIFSTANGKEHTVTNKTKHKLEILILKIIIGIAILLLSTNYIVEQTIKIAELIGVSSFLVSLLMLSLGTNLPELSVAMRSILQGKKEVAFGNYLGSAVFNVLILGVLGMINDRITVDSNFYIIVATTVFGLTGFYFFATSKKELSRKEGLLLILLYVVFLVLELSFRHS